ncbi:TM2 domain-containing protein [Candidatus Gracilibacteria bacterium]|nr:TM2 domain-containing protein [Candidatus Gracilibacteria bacterium]
MEKTVNINWVISMILWFFFGMFGVHRYFNGKIVSGIIMLITFGGLGIWWLIDGIVLVLGKFTDAENKYVKIYKSESPTSVQL